VGEFGERESDVISAGQVNSALIVRAAQVLEERVPAEITRSDVTVEPVHRLQPSFETAVPGFDP